MDQSEKNMCSFLQVSGWLCGCHKRVCRGEVLVDVDRPYRELQRTLAIVSSLTEEHAHRNGEASRVSFENLDPRLIILF